MSVFACYFASSHSAACLLTGLGDGRRSYDFVHLYREHQVRAAVSANTALSACLVWRMSPSEGTGAGCTEVGAHTHHACWQWRCRLDVVGSL
jgi:hypothetical protein